MEKVYVAGKTDDYPRVQRVQAVCRRLGMTITFDWTKTVESWGTSGGLKGQAPDKLRRECAYNDLQGVRDADLLIMLCYPGLCGTLIEFGVAAQREIPIIVVDTPERDSVFFELDNVIRCEDPLDLPRLLLHEFSLDPA